MNEKSIKELGAFLARFGPYLCLVAAIAAVMVFLPGDDDRTRAVVEAMLSEGTAWTTGSRWHGQAVLRVSVSNWSTTVDDVASSLAALHRAAGH